MNLDFQQAIITYPTAGVLQTFLSKVGDYVSLQTANGHIDLTFSHGTENYLLTEASDVPNAWGPLPSSTNCWLYWDINLRTAVRTFGFTTLQPIYSPTLPIAPIDDQHWFNTSTKKMYVYVSGNFRECIRVFAAKIFSTTFTPLGSGFPTHPYAGTQAGLTFPDVATGRILVDDSGKPIKRVDGRFFTTESDFFVNGSPVNIIRLESSVITGTALETMAKYHVVAYTQFGQINLAEYDNTGTTTIAMVMEDLITGQTGTTCIQGHITNPSWNWTTVGIPLWISTSGELIEIDPHLSDPLTYQIGRVPVARVVTQTSIFFDQGLGAKGDTVIGMAPAVNIASTSVLGISKLSVDPIDNANPVVVGDNDPRNTNDRSPLPHTQAATTILTAVYGSLTAGNAQLQLEQIEDGKLSKSGGTMTGSLILAADPVTNLEAATKQYVDTFSISNVDGGSY